MVSKQYIGPIFDKIKAHISFDPQFKEQLSIVNVQNNHNDYKK